MNFDARKRAVEAAAEAICREGGRANALSTIADSAREAPQADIGQSAFAAASDIERLGCAQIIKENQAGWDKEDAFMADVEAAAKK